MRGILALTMAFICVSGSRWLVIFNRAIELLIEENELKDSDLNYAPPPNNPSPPPHPPNNPPPLPPPTPPNNPPLPVIITFSKVSSTSVDMQKMLSHRFNTHLVVTTDQFGPVNGLMRNLQMLLTQMAINDLKRARQPIGVSEERAQHLVQLIGILQVSQSRQEALVVVQPISLEDAAMFAERLGSPWGGLLQDRRLAMNIASEAYEQTATAIARGIAVSLLILAIESIQKARKVNFPGFEAAAKALLEGALELQRDAELADLLDARDDVAEEIDLVDDSNIIDIFDDIKDLIKTASPPSGALPAVKTIPIVKGAPISAAAVKRKRKAASGSVKKKNPKPKPTISWDFLTASLLSPLSPTKSIIDLVINTSFYLWRLDDQGSILRVSAKDFSRPEGRVEVATNPKAVQLAATDSHVAVVSEEGQVFISENTLIKWMASDSKGLPAPRISANSTHLWLVLADGSIYRCGGLVCDSVQLSLGIHATAAWSNAHGVFILSADKNFTRCTLQETATKSLVGCKLILDNIELAVVGKAFYYVYDQAQGYLARVQNNFPERNNRSLLFKFPPGTKINRLIIGPKDALVALDDAGVMIWEVGEDLTRL